MINTSCVFIWQERLVHITAIRGITERKRAEEALQDSHRRLEDTLAEL
jgi:PAS domain-containing protein